MLLPPKRFSYYFIGVDTHNSAIMKIFPLWCEEFGIKNVDLVGYNIEIQGTKKKYQEVIKHLKKYENAKAVIVTSHKINFVYHAKKLFDFFDEYAQLLEEVSCISKRNKKIWGFAKDPIASRMALESFLPYNYWKNNQNAQVLIMGAGGSGLALSVALIKVNDSLNVPAKIILTDIKPESIMHSKTVHSKIKNNVNIDYVIANANDTNSKIIEKMPSGSLIVNATGLGKDSPGSPIISELVFPYKGYIWDFNYRGDLNFIYQAKSQAKKRNLFIEDGWNYFIYGWILIFKDEFNINITDEKINILKFIAKKTYKKIFLNKDY